MAANEQRRSPRKRVALPASVSRVNAGLFGNEVVAQMLNLSRTGALIEAKELFVPGEVCKLNLPKVTGGYGDIPGRIVWAQRQAQGSYRAGIAFRNLSPEEVYVIDLHLVRSAAQTG